MSDKIWTKKETVFIEEDDFIALDAVGNILVLHNLEDSGDQLIINVLEVQILLHLEYLNLISNYIDANFGIVHQSISVTILEMGAYYSRGFIERKFGGYFNLTLENKIKEKEIVEPEEYTPLTYLEKINDDNYLESIAHLDPQQFVEELGADWIEVQRRFHAKRGNISRNRTDKWIKECVLFGNEHQRNIKDYTTSPAKEGLLRTTLSEKDLPIIIATKQDIAYVKSREVVTKGELFVWEDLRGNRKTRGSYASSEAWSNRTALKENTLDKKTIQYMLHMYYGIGSEEEINDVMQSFTINAGYEAFTSVISGVQTEIGSTEVDGVVDTGFITEMKKVLDIGNEANSILVAYITFMYMYGGTDIEMLKAGFKANDQTFEYNEHVVDALYVDPRYAGINIDQTNEQPQDFRDKGALAAIRGLIRLFMPEYAEAEDDNPFLQKIIDQVYARASQLAERDLIAGIKDQVTTSGQSISERISGLDTYFQDIDIKQLRQMVETYTGDDKEKEKVENNYTLWGEIYVMILLEEAKEEENPQFNLNLNLYGYGPDYVGEDNSAIMQKIGVLALSLGVRLPTTENAQAIKKQLRDRSAMLADSPYGHQELFSYEQEEFDKVNALLSKPGPYKYRTLLRILFNAFYQQLIWSDQLSYDTEQRLEQDEMQKEHFELLKNLEFEFEDITPIQNYMFISSSFKSEIEAAKLNHINQSNGFSLPIFSARYKGGDKNAPRVLIIFPQPGDYNVIEKSTLKASIIIAEDRNLIPPGVLHFKLGGVWNKIDSDNDWQWSEILAVIGIGLAIVAAVAAAPFTGGASTAAVPYLTAAAIGVGVASSVFSIKEKSEIGALTTGTALFEVGMIAASLIPFLGTGARILRGTTAYARLGKLGQLTRFVTNPAVTRLGAQAGLIMTAAGAYMFAETLVAQLDVIADMEDGPEKEKAIRELIRFGALTGLMLFVAAKSDYQMLNTSPKAGLHASVKAEQNNRQKIKDYDAKIQGVKTRYAQMTFSSIGPVVPIARYAETIFWELRKISANISSLRDRAAIKALGLSDDEFAKAHKLAKQVDNHLNNHPHSTYQNREEDLFMLLMQGKRRFNANGKLVMASPEKMKVLEWKSWDQLKKTKVDGEEVAIYNGRYFTKDAVDAMMPRGLQGNAQGIPPSVIDDILANGTKFSKNGKNYIKKDGIIIEFSGKGGVVGRITGEFQFRKEGIIQDIKSSNISIHLEGEINGRGKAVGGHLQSEINSGRIKVIEPPPPVIVGGEIVKAKIEILNPSTGLYKKKDALSTFFPQNWSKEKIYNEIAEIMLNPANKKHSRLYVGKGTGGIEIEVRLTGPENNLKFDTAFPL